MRPTTRRSTPASSSSMQTARPMTTTSQRPSTASSGKSCTRSPSQPMLATQPRPSPTSSSTAGTRPPTRARTSSPGPLSRILPRRRTTSGLPASSASEGRRGDWAGSRSRATSPTTSTRISRAAGCRPGTRRNTSPSTRVRTQFHHPFRRPSAHSSWPVRRAHAGVREARTHRC